MSNSSQRERIMRYMQDTYGTEAEYLWADSLGAAYAGQSAGTGSEAALRPFRFRTYTFQDSGNVRLRAKHPAAEVEKQAVRS